MASYSTPPLPLVRVLEVRHSLEPLPLCLGEPVEDLIAVGAQILAEHAAQLIEANPDELSVVVFERLGEARCCSESISVEFLCHDDPNLDEQVVGILCSSPLNQPTLAKRERAK